MSGDAPVENGVEVPHGSAVETGQAQPLPEMPAPPSPSEQLADAIAEAPDPITAIRTGADDELAQLTLDTDLSPEAQQMADDASKEFNENLNRAADGQSPSTEASDQDYGGAYTSKVKKANAEDGKTREFSPDDTVDVPVSDQDVADVAVEGAAEEAVNPLEPQLTDKEFATALLDERKQLEAVAPEDPRYDDAQNRIRRIDGYRAFVYSDKDKLGTLSRDEALPRLRESMERGRMSIQADVGMKDGSVTEEVVEGSENVAAPASETIVQVEAPGGSEELPTPVEPLSDAQLDAELAYLKAESGGDRDHPYGLRIRAINRFKAIRDSKDPTIRGNMSREDAVRDLRAELTRGAMEVPRPESLVDTTSLAAASSDQTLPSGEKQLDDRGRDSEIGTQSTDPALTAVLGKLDAAGEAATVEDTASATTVEPSPADTQDQADENSWIEALRKERLDYLATPPRNPDNMPWKRNQDIQRFLELREKGPKDESEEAEMTELKLRLAPEQTALKGEAVEDITVGERSNDNPAEASNIDPEAQAIAEKRAELITRIKEAQNALRPKDDSEEIDPLTKEKLDQIGFRLASLEGTTISGDDAHRIVSRQGYKVESILQADSMDELDAVLYPSIFRKNLKAEIPKLEELVSKDPTNTAAAERLTRIKAWDGTSIDPGSSKEAEQMNAERKYLAQRFDYGDTPEDDEADAEATTRIDPTTKVEPVPPALGTSAEVDGDKAQVLEREKDTLKASIQDRILDLRSYDEDDPEELIRLKSAQIAELDNELHFLDHVPSNGSRYQDILRTSAQRADLFTQAESIDEIDAIKFPGDLERSLQVEANILAQKLDIDPDNPAFADRLDKIANFLAQDMYPHDPELVRKQTALRKELVIPFDGGKLADVDLGDDEDEGFMPTVRVSGAAGPRASIGSRFKAGFGKGMDLIRGGRRSRNSVVEPATTDSMPLPPWMPGTAPEGAEQPAPVRWSRPAAGNVVPLSEQATLNTAPAAVEAAPAAVEAASATPPLATPEAEPALTPEPELSQARLDTLLAPGGTLTGSEAREAARLMSERTEAIKLDKLGGLRNATQEARYKELSKQFPGVLEAERAAREAASPPLYSDQQKALNYLRGRHAANDFPKDRVEEFATLETAEARYKELSEKSKSEEGLSSKDQKELDEMGDTWKDPVVRGKEKEIMDLAESSLDSDKDFANFVDKLQEYSINKLGMFHPAFQEGIKLAVQDFFNRSDSNMTWQEKTALKDVKRLAQEMQKEIVTIMTFKKQIEAQFKKQEELKKEIEVDQELVKGEIGPDDTNKQKAATELPGKYAQLGALNAAINVTFRRADDANFNYQWRNRRIKRALGLDSLKDNALGMWDDINRIFNFAKNNFGYTMDNPLSTRRYSGKI